MAGSTCGGGGDADDDDDEEVTAAIVHLTAARTSSSSSSSIDSAWQALVNDTRFTQAVERAVRQDALRRALTMPTSAAPCTLACRPHIVSFAVALYATAPTCVAGADGTLDFGAEPVTGASLHACVASLCPARDAALHATNCTSRVRHTLTEPCSSGGGVHFCATHGRAHVCIASSCRHAVDSQRMRVCPLSARTLGLELRTAYGYGNTIMTDEITEHRDAVEMQRRSSSAMRRSSASCAIENVLAAGSAQTRDITPLAGGKRKTPSPSPSPASSASSSTSTYTDTDIPADDVFPADGAANTFGDGAAPVLARLYAEAYASVHLLLMSDDRARIEERNRQLVLAEARRRINSYLSYQRKSGEPVMLSVCRQIERRAFNARRVYPELVLPPHAIARLTAYYALVAVEMHMQLVRCASRLAETSESMQRVFERYTTTSFAAVVPNVLDILHSGLRSGSVPIAVEESTLSIFPESQTIEELGILQKTCTDVKKIMKKIIVAASNANVSVNELRVTQLDTTLVMFDTDSSVVSLFLAERRRRIQRGTETQQ